jgi:hypothetical protein
MSGRMTLKARIDLAKSGKLFDVEIPGPGKGRIEDGGNMTVRKKEKVFIFTFHVEPGIMFQYLEIERCEEIGGTKGPSRMTALSAIYHSYDVSPDL